MHILANSCFNVCSLFALVICVWLFAQLGCESINRSPGTGSSAWSLNACRTRPQAHREGKTYQVILVCGRGQLELNCIEFDYIQNKSGGSFPISYEGWWTPAGDQFRPFFTHWTLDRTGTGLPFPFTSAHPVERVPHTLMWAGLSARSVTASDVRGSGRAFVINLPIPEAIGIGGLMPATWWVLYRLQRRRRKCREEGRCVVCDYDLRATPGRCPECGTAAASTR